MVNIILSRKGFDSSAGGCASPILPDGRTMVSLPIPDHGISQWKYQDLKEPITGKSYYQIVEELRPRCTAGMDRSHLDPDINPEVCPEKERLPVFGQESTAQTILEKNGVGVGDVFLYFGWYRGTVEEEGKLRYARKRDGLDFFHTCDIQAVFGYLRIKEVITEEDEMKERFPLHPHSGRGYPHNTLYVSDRDSSGVFGFDEKRVLTKEGCTRSRWDAEKLSWMLDDLDDMSMSPVVENGRINFNGRWQELVIRDASKECRDWVKMITNDAVKL